MKDTTKQEVKITYQDLESVKQRWGISQTSILFIGGVVLGHVAIGACTEEYLFDATGE